MVNVLNPATLRGFHVSVADIGDQMHLCQPLLSFEGDALYFAYRLDWRDDPRTLTIADPSAASVLGTLLPPTCWLPIASGEGVVAVGGRLVRAAADAKVDLLASEVPFVPIDGSNCWIGVAEPDLYAELRTRLAEDALAAFDEELTKAVCNRRRLSERGNAALFLIRKCGPRRSNELALRQLAGALQNRERALYRRLLVRFEIELGEKESDLDKRVNSYIKRRREVPATGVEVDTPAHASASTGPSVPSEPARPVSVPLQWRLVPVSISIVAMVLLVAVYIYRVDNTDRAGRVAGEAAEARQQTEAQAETVQEQMATAPVADAQAGSPVSQAEAPATQEQITVLSKFSTLGLPAYLPAFEVAATRWAAAGPSSVPGINPIDSTGYGRPH